MSLAVSWSVTVNGKPATDAMNPYIESIECTDKEGGSADTARLTFDDSDGQCMLPAKGSTIVIEIEGVTVFEGVTDVPESIGARGSGMQINVDCTGHDKRGAVKERLGLHKDDATLKDFLEAAAKKAGYSIKVDPELGKIKRPYWSTSGRSFQQLGAELGEEFGATFKLRGKKAVFAKRGQGAAPGGSAMPTVRAVRGENLRSWRITPAESAPRFTKARTRFYDRDAAKWQEQEVEIGTAPGSPQAADIDGAARADKDSAKSRSDGAKTKSEREGGSGDVTIDLDVSAFAEGTCVCEIRPGIDGNYRITSRTHRLTRDAGGSETRLELKQPQGAAGTDDRKAGAGS